MKKLRLFVSLPAIFASVLAAVSAAEPARVSFREVTVDDRVGIGYGIAVADMNGDAQPDIVLADKDRFVWYENPAWTPHGMTGAITERDHVCVDARDLNGDGMAEVAVGAQWNPGDTIGSGAVFFLLPDADRGGAWTPVRLQHQPVTHRMRWFRNRRGGFDLAVLPLHGPGNQGGRGDGVRLLAYERPDDVRRPWITETVDDGLHLTHNLDVVAWSGQPGEDLLVAGREGIFLFVRHADGWRRTRLVGEGDSNGTFQGAGEVRGGRWGGGGRFLTSIEPMHGNQLVVYRPVSPGDAPAEFGHRRVLDDALVQGHAIATGDLLGVGSDQIVAGWRGARPGDSTGIRLFIPPRDGDGPWQTVDIDGAGMACEDLKLADLNGDGRLDVVAAGRATNNLKIYFNQGPL